jgi:hypothetical protein
MKPTIWLSLLFCLSLSAQTPLTTDQLIDRADLSDPEQYILDIEELVRENLDHLRLQRGAEIPGITWETRAFSFEAKSYLDHVYVPRLIDYVLSEYRSGEPHEDPNGKPLKKAANKPTPKKKHSNPVAVALCKRGLTTEELRYLHQVVTSQPDHVTGLGVAIEECFHYKADEAGLDIEQVKLAIWLDHDRLQAFEELYDFYYEHKHAMKLEVYAEFLSNFSLNSRRALLSYAYERALDGWTHYHQYEETTVDNWRETAPFMNPGN